jgi:hypothetical protein
MLLMVGLSRGCPALPATSATVPTVWYVVSNGTTGNLTESDLHYTISKTNAFMCGSSDANYPFDMSAVATSQATIHNCSAKCQANCSANINPSRAQTMAQMCASHCAAIGNCGQMDSCELANCYCEGTCNLMGDSSMPLYAPRVDSGIRLRLDEVVYINHPRWHETCCCQDATVAWTPSQVEIFDQLVDKQQVRDRISIISCNMARGGTAGQSAITGSDYCPGGPAVFLDFSSIDGTTRQMNDPAGSLLAHEVGHWLGLSHTFARSCTDGGARMRSACSACIEPLSPRRRESAAVGSLLLCY